LLSISSPYNHQSLIWLHMHCNGEKVKAMLDSGSEVNLADVRTWKSIIQAPMDTNNTIKLHVANGSQGETFGLVEKVVLTCGGAKTTGNFYIGNYPFQFLLGRPWMTTNGVGIEEELDGTYVTFRNPIDPDADRMKVMAVPKPPPGIIVHPQSYSTQKQTGGEEPLPFAYTISIIAEIDPLFLLNEDPDTFWDRFEAGLPIDGSGSDQDRDEDMESEGSQDMDFSISSSSGEQELSPLDLSGDFDDLLQKSFSSSDSQGGTDSSWSEVQFPTDNALGLQLNPLSEETTQSTEAIWGDGDDDYDPWKLILPGSYESVDWNDISTAHVFTSTKVPSDIGSQSASQGYTSASEGSNHPILPPPTPNNSDQEPQYEEEDEEEFSGSIAFGVSLREIVVAIIIITTFAALSGLGSKDGFRRQQWVKISCYMISIAVVLFSGTMGQSPLPNPTTVRFADRDFTFFKKVTAETMMNQDRDEFLNSPTVWQSDKARYTKQAAFAHTPSVPSVLKKLLQTFFPGSYLVKVYLASMQKIYNLEDSELFIQETLKHILFAFKAHGGKPIAIEPEEEEDTDLDEDIAIESSAEIIGERLIHPSPVLRVKILSPRGRLPTRESEEAAGYDLYSAEDKLIPPFGQERFNLQIAIQVPYGTYGRIAPRSSLAYRSRIGVSGEVVDRDYRGPVKVTLTNGLDANFVVQEGDRIAQLVIEKIERPEVQETHRLQDTVRGTGGFGSTGI
jgi:dUTP pyrophosphatase